MKKSDTWKKHRLNKDFMRIKAAVDAVDTTGMTKEEAERERMYAAFAAPYADLQKEKKHGRIRRIK